MGIRLRDGRVFTDEDRADSPPVIIVNESMAKHCWPGQARSENGSIQAIPRRTCPGQRLSAWLPIRRVASRDEPDGDQWYTSLKQPGSLYGNDYQGEPDKPRRRVSCSPLHVSRPTR